MEMHKAAALFNLLNLGPSFAGCWLLATSSPPVPAPITSKSIGIVSSGDPRGLPESVPEMSTMEDIEETGTTASQPKRAHTSLRSKA